MPRTKEKVKGYIDDDKKIDAYEMLTFSMVYTLAYNLLETGEATEMSILNMVFAMLKIPSKMWRDFVDPIDREPMMPINTDQQWGGRRVNIPTPDYYGEPTEESVVILPDGTKILRRDLFKYTDKELKDMQYFISLDINALVQEMAKIEDKKLKKVWNERINSKKALISYYQMLLDARKKHAPR